MTDQRHAFITGTAGFIGFHLAGHLLDQGWRVTGYDGISDYYDPALKRARHDILAKRPGFSAHEALLEDRDRLLGAVSHAKPDVIIHLAAQAGVRYSVENPAAYMDANVTGSFHILEAAREAGVDHLLMASTSSVYGANREMPFAETQKADTPMSFYAATKKANEAMAHAWAHIHGVPITLFRFFTVYGPWGRPDMALFKFTKAILEDRPIDVYNYGEMWRDFTYVGDLVQGIGRLIECVPPAPSSAPAPGAARPAPLPGDSLSPVAPWRVVNIGNSQSVKLTDFIDALEAALGRPAQRNLTEMQQGDVPATWADAELLRALIGPLPQTSVAEGVAAFVAWYRAYHGLA